MAFVYAFLIAGCICALTQCLSSLKVPFPLVAILLMVLGGGLCTKLGFFDWLNALSAAGPAVTAVGAQRDPGWPGRGLRRLAVQALSRRFCPAADGKQVTV